MFVVSNYLIVIAGIDILDKEGCENLKDPIS